MRNQKLFFPRRFSGSSNVFRLSVPPPSLQRSSPVVIAPLWTVLSVFRATGSPRMRTVLDPSAIMLPDRVHGSGSPMTATGAPSAFTGAPAGGITAVGASGDVHEKWSRPPRATGLRMSS